MGRQGPCCHCGIDKTPLWRNGPAEKPTLCNACGSRYRIRGTLENYAPNHTKGRPIVKRPKTSNKAISKKANCVVDKSFFSNVWPSTSSDNTSTHKSNSRSTTSYSQFQRCFKVEEGNGGQVQQSLWNTRIPSKKRSLVVYRSPTPVQRLHKALCYILKYKYPSILSENTEDDVLIYNNTNNPQPQTTCNEIGLGIIPLKPAFASTNQAHKACSPLMDT